MNRFLVNVREMNRNPSSMERIRFPDCDPFGHLNNAKYLTYFVNAREDHIRDYYGFDAYEHAQKTKRGWVVRGAGLAYSIPALNNDLVRISTQLAGLGSGTLKVEGVMESEKGIHSISRVELTYVDLATGRPVRHEGDLQELFENLLAALPEEEDLESRLRALRRSRRNERELAAN